MWIILYPVFTMVFIGAISYRIIKQGSKIAWARLEGGNPATFPGLEMGITCKDSPFEDHCSFFQQPSIPIYSAQNVRRTNMGPAVRPCGLRRMSAHRYWTLSCKRQSGVQVFTAIYWAVAHFEDIWLFWFKRQNVNSLANSSGCAEWPNQNHIGWILPNFLQHLNNRCCHRKPTYWLLVQGWPVFQRQEQPQKRAKLFWWLTNTPPDLGPVRETAVCLAAVTGCQLPRWQRVMAKTLHLTF